MYLSVPKYIGSCCKNSFIIVDLRSGDIERSEKVSYATATAKEFNVDSCLYILNSEIATIRLEIFERDGSQSDTCGNGMLLVTHFLEIKEGTIETGGGIFKTTCDADTVTVVMGTQFVKVASVPQDTSFLYIKSGEPHVVTLSESIESIDLTELGRKFQLYFPKGVNVNILEKIDSNTYKIKTFERGVLNVTASCGTGSLSSYTATNFINGEMNQGVVEFKCTGGSHWVSREGRRLKLQTLRSFCVIDSLHT